MSHECRALGLCIERKPRGRKCSLGIIEAKVKVYGNTYGHTKKDLLLRPLFDKLVAFISSPPLASLKSKRNQNGTPFPNNNKHKKI